MKTSLKWEHGKTKWSELVSGTENDVAFAKTIITIFDCILNRIGASNDGEIAVKTFLSTLSLLGVVKTVEGLCGVSNAMMVEKLIDLAPNENVLLNGLDFILSLADENYVSSARMHVVKGG